MVGRQFQIQYTANIYYCFKLFWLIINYLLTLKQGIHFIKLLAFNRIQNDHISIQGSQVNYNCLMPANNLAYTYFTPSWEHYSQFATLAVFCHAFLNEFLWQKCPVSCLMTNCQKIFLNRFWSRNWSVSAILFQKPPVLQVFKPFWVYILSISADFGRSSVNILTYLTYSSWLFMEFKWQDLFFLLPYLFNVKK